MPQPLRRHLVPCCPCCGVRAAAVLADRSGRCDAIAKRSGCTGEQGFRTGERKFEPHSSRPRTASNH
eukprot:5966426-Prymnesium_polylepis.1